MPLAPLDSKVDYRDQLHMGHSPGSEGFHVYTVCILRDVLGRQPTGPVG
jgi:hypothetical protein